MDFDKELDLLIKAVEKAHGNDAELKERITDLEQKLSAVASGGVYTSGEPRGFNVGRAVTESSQFKALLDGTTKTARISLKTAIINATGQNQPLAPSDRLAGIVHSGERRFTMRDLLPTARTSSNLVEYAKENVYTNNAGPQVGGSPEAFENVTKPESGITFTLQTAAVSTLAHWIPVSKQVLADSPMLQQYINDRLMYGLKLKEDTQLLLGTGSNGELPGLYTNRTAYSVTSPLSYTTKLDIIRDAMDQVQASEYDPDGIVLNGRDFKEMQLAKDSQGRYMIGQAQDGNGPRLWGLPVVVTNSIASGTFLVGAFGMAAQLWDREDAMVEIGLNNDDFTKNMVTILCEERLALTIYRADALVGGSFTVS